MYVILVFLHGTWNLMAWCLYMKNPGYKPPTKTVHSRYFSEEQNTNPMTVLMLAEDKTSMSKAFQLFLCGKKYNLQKERVSVLQLDKVILYGSMMDHDVWTI